MQSLCYEHQFSFILKAELIIIKDVSHLDSLWRRGQLETDNSSSTCSNDLTVIQLFAIFALELLATEFLPPDFDETKKYAVLFDV